VEEISRIVGCPTNTVWSRLHHARLELTKMAERMKSDRQSRSETSEATPLMSADRAPRGGNTGNRTGKASPANHAAPPASSMMSGGDLTSELDEMGERP
jgi:hypothetical protein